MVRTIVNTQNTGILVVHWDGKLVKDPTGAHEKVERLPILVTSEKVEKLLSAPPLERGTVLQ